MSEEKKTLPTIISEIVPEEVENDPNLPAEFKDKEQLTAAVGRALGRPVTDLMYGPFGEALHLGADAYLQEHEPELWARLQKHKFGS